VRAAQAGDIVELGPGTFRRCGPFTSPRLTGSAPVVVEGQGNATTITRDTTVGSTDAIYLGPGDHDLSFKNLWIQADDRAAIKTVSGVGPNFSFENITIYGFGWPYDPSGWKDDSKWGIHTYDTNGWTETGVNVWNIFGEHCHYDHNGQGDRTYTNISCCFAGRTAFQDVSRMSEGKEGHGKLTYTNVYVQDVCLEQGGGGSAFTFAGGRPTSDILLDGCVVRLGCDARLISPFNQNITGSLVVSNPHESAPGKGDGAWPGGVHLFVVQHSTFEVGTIYSGQGSALRSNVKIDCPAVGYFFNDDSILTTRGAGQIAVALEVTNQAGPVQFTNMRTVTGKVKYRDDPVYNDFAAFQAAHGELFK